MMRGPTIRGLLTGVLPAVAVAVATTVASGATSAQPSPALHGLALPGIRGGDVMPFATDARAFAFVFLRTDCPVSNRYAPEITRLHDTFARDGAAFWIVYPGPQRIAVIRRHVADFAHAAPVLLDPRLELVDLTGATITPEAAVFDASRQLAYRGRIDDRYVDLGRWRHSPTVHDVRDVLSALLRGERVPYTTRPAIGCFIDDLR